MDTMNSDEQVIKACANVPQSRGLFSEPLQQYIAEFREELRSEMAGISEIKWK